MTGFLASKWLALLTLLQQRRAVEFYTLPDPEPPRGILDLIVESFLFVGIALGATVVLGIGFGIFRLWLLRRYPDNWFNGSGKDPVRIDLS